MGFSSRPIEDERGNYFNEIYKADKNKKLTSLFIKKLRQVIVNRQCPNIDQISLNGKQKMEENDIMAPKIPKLF